MNQETFGFTQNKDKHTKSLVPFSLDLQISNNSDANLNSNHNEYMQYNFVPIFQYSINQNSSVFQQNFLKQNNNVDHLYIKKQKKKPFYRPHCKWSKEEDEKLKELVKEYGENDWRHLAKRFEGRNSRQCRERWNYYLNPILKQGQWTNEEDEMILEKYQEHGPRWMEITKYFEHRTDSMIKNRFNYLIRKQKRNRKSFYDIYSSISEYNAKSNSNDNPSISSDLSDSNQFNEFPSFLFLEQNLPDSNIDNDLNIFSFNDSLYNEMPNNGDLFNE